MLSILEEVLCDLPKIIHQDRWMGVGLYTHEANPVLAHRLVTNYGDGWLILQRGFRECTLRLRASSICWIVSGRCELEHLTTLASGTVLSVWEKDKLIFFKEETWMVVLLPPKTSRVSCLLSKPLSLEHAAEMFAYFGGSHQNQTTEEAD